MTLFPLQVAYVFYIHEFIAQSKWHLSLLKVLIPFVNNNLKLSKKYPSKNEKGSMHS